MKSITTKFLIWMVLLTSILLCFLLYHQYVFIEAYNQNIVEQQASMALHFNLSIRKYAADNIRPLMYKFLGQDEFIPSAMSTSYISRSIFEDVRKDFPDYIIKFSSDNPRNPVNKAGPEELKIIKHFNKNPHLKRWEGVIKIAGNQYMGIFRARRMDTSCLRCHGDPKDAPASLVKQYGDKAGFHRPIGEIIGMDVVAIPLRKITQGLWSKSKNTFFLIIGSLLLFFFSIVVVMRFIIIKRITNVAGHFEKIISEKDYIHIEPIKIEGKDEISQMAKGFNLLVGELGRFYSLLEKKVASRTKALQNKNKQLKNEIDLHIETEKALKESEIRFKALHNASFGGIAIHDKGVILDCNLGLSKMTGYSIKELVGMDGLLLISEKLRDAVMHKIATGYEKPYEAVALRKNGDEFPIRLEARNIPYKGKHVRAVEFRDITDDKLAEAEREKLQLQLNQAQKMESVGRLAGGVAHDFNNMLSVILGNTEIILEELETTQPFYDNLEEIQNAAVRSTDVVRQLLAFARKQTIAPKVLDLNKTVEEMLKMLRRLLGENIDLSWKPAADIWFVKIDPGQIDQILVNLTVNARDAINGVGSLIIETGRQIFDQEYCNGHPGFIPGDFVMLTVSDNGCGMDKNTLNNLFEPFYTTKDMGKGTGLGLATVYGIVKQNNGFINAYSEPGRGSTFKIYLPRFLADEKTDKTIPEKKVTAGGSETILLVEDEPAILKMTRMMLERKGYTVLSAATPAEAVKKAKNYSNAIDLLMTDVVMPEMNGRDLAEHITTLYPNIQLLFMSGYTANVIAQKGFLDEELAFIQKPFSTIDLAEKLREVLNISSEEI